jgi:phosphatidylserine/phosphatidylglycerophosphate/cardiolipin synthase-like enzyme
VDTVTEWPPRQLLEAAVLAARSLPPAQAERLGRALDEARSPDEAVSIAALIPTAPFAAAVDQLLASWRSCPEVTGLTVGTAVAAAAHAHASARRSSEVELVVSGPSSGALHARRTEQVLLQLISEAHEEVLLVTFALQMYEELREALVEASGRGVHVVVLAEDPADNPGFRGDPGRVLRGLPVEQLHWPSHERSPSGGSLHAKLVLVDGSTAFITSANLTERGSARNLEVGVLLRGTDIALGLRAHIDDLLRLGTLRRAMGAA